MTLIVCPHCSRRHRVNIDTIPEGKTIVARCKACGHKFPVEVDKLRLQAQTHGTRPTPHTPTPEISTPEKIKPEISKPETLEPEITKPELSKPEPPELIKAARKICVSLSKGGVGKTTTSVNLGAGLALAGYRVLLVDTDTQGQSGYVLGKRTGVGLTELLTGELTPDEAIVQVRKNFWLLGGGKSLAGVKRIIDRKSFGAEWTLSEALKPLESKFDFILIDTSPGWDQLTVNVLFYATEILIPVALEVMPLHGLSEFMKSLRSIQKYRKEVSLKYVVPTFMDTRVKNPQIIYDRLKKLYPKEICKPIRYNENFSEAPSFGKTIFEFAPGCSGAVDYRELVRRVTMNDSLLQ
ncbi:ParA family protein [Desulforapulum autotrophicum HRM2]|uniref:ParA family protein n=1 Tax=Desulforapulum autotrophicum (strain ATCC 43914 / DSM 3382 / VKM B-1955 / HRM2) TaxID=177437 RepID=C0QFP1_DESAH|nr:AAA family ATPase [Desulforapulum autotrophicum]ACN15459.1 ParA family protein [Desulforapulum autotrophicum HRM2]